MDAEVCPSLQTAARNYFLMLEVSTAWQQGTKHAMNAVAGQPLMPCVMQLSNDWTIAQTIMHAP